MLNLKKTLLTILAVSNTFAFAGSMGPTCVPGTDCEKPAWSISTYALYLQPSFGGNGLGYTSFSNYGSDLSANTIEVNGATNYMHNINPQWNWGFQIDAAYYLNSKNDIDINYYHFNENTQGYLPQGTLFAGSAPGLYAGLVKVAPSWNAINLESGHRFDFDNIKTLRLHAGVSFANINNKFTNYPQVFSTGNPIFITTDKISYNGFGPRFGGDFNYIVGHGLGLYTKAAGSLLVGTAKQSVTGYKDFIFNTFNNVYSAGNYSQSHNGVIVPEIEAKLGLKYDYSLAQGIITFDLGYLWINYLNAIVSQVGANVNNSVVSSSTTTNFNLNGLYFGLKWMGNV